MTQISPNMFRVISPVDGSEYAVRQYADAETLDRTIANAQKALIQWRRTPLAERVAIVLRFGEEMKARAPALAEAIAHQIGRPLWQCDETPRLVQIGEVLSGLADDVFQPVAYPSDAQVTRYTRATTGGIHFSICAWNVSREASSFRAETEWAHPRRKRGLYGKTILYQIAVHGSY